jgi:hypothetical protein
MLIAAESAQVVIKTPLLELLYIATDDAGRYCTYKMCVRETNGIARHNSAKFADHKE